MIVLLFSDPSLEELCAAELYAVGIRDIATLSHGDAFPKDTSVILTDEYTSLPLAGFEIPPSAVMISRTTTTFRPLTQTRFFRTLGRPFLIEDLRTAVAEAQAAYTEKARSVRSPVSAPPERRRMVSRKAVSQKTADLKLSDGAILCGTSVIPLTRSEYAVFHALFLANGAPVSREALASLLGGKGGTNLPDVHVSAIRKKLAPYGKDLLIRTVRGKGYALLQKSPVSP